MGSLKLYILIIYLYGKQTNLKDILAYNTALLPVFISANTGHSPDAVLMLGQRRRRWANIETALGENPVFVGLALPVERDRYTDVDGLIKEVQ